MTSDKIKKPNRLLISVRYSCFCPETEFMSAFKPGFIDLNHGNSELSFYESLQVY